MQTDPKFLEWIGQMMLLSAKNMEQAEKFMKWFREGYPKGEEWEKWLEPYLQVMPKGAEAGTEELKNLFEGFFANLGIVSRQEYLELEKQYQELKREVEGLKTRMSAEREKGFDLFGQWANLIKSMSESNARLFEQWQKMILNPKKSEKPK